MKQFTWVQIVIGLVAFTLLMGVVGYVENAEPVAHDAHQERMEGVAWARHYVDRK